MLKAALKKNNGWLLSVVAGLAAFGTYSCMYAFRKAFVAATYSGISFWGIDYKILLILAQVIGYMLSKFLGIQYVSGMKPNNRSKSILILIGFSWLSLLGFALVPAPYNIVFLFLNGFPLGLIWGLVFSFLEGRRNTELMAAIMASSLVFASGFVKSVARYLLQVHNVKEYWMPFLTGLIFVVPLCIFVFLLNQIPPPTDEDIAARSERKPMTNIDRKNFIVNYWPGLLLIVITYLMLTVVRDLRDNFEVEIWTNLGYGKQPAIFTQIDFPVALLVLTVMALLITVKDNMKAFIYLHYIIMFGCISVFIATLLFSNGFINPIAWMSIAAFGLYLSYVPYNSIYFERMIAAFRFSGNVGFVMYIADAMGYLGSVSILIYKQFGSTNISWLLFFKGAMLIVSVIGAISAILSLSYFQRKYHRTISSIQKVVVL
jgi:MFS family permease